MLLTPSEAAGPAVCLQRAGSGVGQEARWSCDTRGRRRVTHTQEVWPNESVLRRDHHSLTSVKQQLHGILFQLFLDVGEEK